MQIVGFSHEAAHIFLYCVLQKGKKEESMSSVDDEEDEEDEDEVI